MQRLSRNIAVRSRNAVACRGIKNLGNTCFLNAVLQSLASIHAFHTFLHKRQWNDELNKQLRESIAELSLTVNSSVDPTPIIKVAPLKKKFFCTREQQDAQELMQFIFSYLQEQQTVEPSRGLTNLLEEDNKHSTNMNIFMNVFMHEANKPKLSRPLAKMSPSQKMFNRDNPFSGLLASGLRCGNCHRSSIQFNHFHDISLSIPEKDISVFESCDLDRCLKYFTDPEKISDVMCGYCNSQSNPEKRLVIAKPPHALCLHIRRLVMSRDMRLKKLNSLVTFPPKLDISPYCSFSTLSDDTEVEENTSMSGSGFFGTTSTPALHSTDPFRGLSLKGLTGGFSQFASTADLEQKFHYTPPVRSYTKKISSKASSPYEYNLKAVIVHEGSAMGGHFSAYRKLNSKVPITSRAEYEKLMAGLVSGRAEIDDEDEGYWIHISDETCTPVDEAEVLKAQAYMLFYEKAKTDSTISHDDISTKAKTALKIY